jgi:hypothetical protein
MTAKVQRHGKLSLDVVQSLNKAFGCLTDEKVVAGPLRDRPIAASAQ